MLNKTFLKNKVSRQININGQEYKFIRYGIDEFSQKTNDIEKIISLNGIFHVAGAGLLISLSESEGTRVPTKQNPAIICLFEDGKDIKNDDEVLISGELFKVVDKVNINMFDIAYDIFLEVVKDEF